MAIVVFLLFTNHSLPHFAKKSPLKKKKLFFLTDLSDFCVFLKARNCSKYGQYFRLNIQAI